MSGRAAGSRLVALVAAAAVAAAAGGCGKKGPPRPPAPAPTPPLEEPGPDIETLPGQPPAGSPPARP